MIYLTHVKKSTFKVKMVISDNLINNHVHFQKKFLPDEIP